MTISVENVKEVVKQMTEMQKKIETNIGKGLAKCCQLVQVTAQKSMTNTEINTAVTYYNTNKSLGHHPSVVTARKIFYASIGIRNQFLYA